jgi:hypothetical protein
MVKSFIFFMLISLNLMAQNVIVTAEMNYTELFAGSPLTGTVTITHDKNLKVDTNSFKLGGKPLKVSFLNDVLMSDTSPLIVSLYNFEIPTKPKGLHVLPEVSVKVGGKTFKSFSVSYQVYGADGQQDLSTPAKSPQVTADSSQRIENTELLLQVKIDGPVKLYPGQQTTFIYKFLYRGHIDLNKEFLPLLEGVGLKKVGDKQIRDYEENNLNVSEFSQVFAADKPGNFVFGPSMIEGTAYETNAKGQKVYATSPLRSEVPAAAIEVLPFPAAGKPSSFNGAIGTYIFSATLKSPSEVVINEKIVLLIEITGDPKQLSTVQAPDLCCQPMFSGMFKPSDLPPITTIVGNTKQFLVELRPLSSTIKQIPPIEFSSFDPTNGKYVITKSSPIPINVLQGSDILKDPLNANIPAKPDDAILKDDNIQKLEPIEITGADKVTPSDLHDKPFGSYWNLLWLPALAVLIYTQINFKKEWQQKQPVLNGETSENLFKAALNTEAGSPEFYRQLQKSLLKALQEQGSIPNSDIEPEMLETTGLQGDVKVFLTRLNEVRFSGSKQFNQAIIVTAKEIFGKIKGFNS